jgi:hypothetical protein
MFRKNPPTSPSSAYAITHITSGASEEHLDRQPGIRRDFEVTDEEFRDEVGFGSGEYHP